LRRGRAAVACPALATASISAPGLGDRVDQRAMALVELELFMPPLPLRGEVDELQCSR